MAQFEVLLVFNPFDPGYNFRNIITLKILQQRDYHFKTKTTVPALNTLIA